MNLSDVFTILFSILGFLIVVIGYWLLAYALAPHLAERSAERISRAPVKVTLGGAAMLIPLVVGGLILSGKAPSAVAKIICVAVALFALFGALLGSSGLALRIGNGLPSPRDEGEPWRRVWRGGLVLALTFVLPFIGTFIVLPGTLFAGFGALFFGRAKTDPLLAPAPETNTAPPLPSVTL